jgi:hypothetical protein
MCRASGQHIGADDGKAPPTSARRRELPGPGHARRTCAAGSSREPCQAPRHFRFPPRKLSELLQCRSRQRCAMSGSRRMRMIRVSVLSEIRGSVPLTARRTARVGYALGSIWARDVAVGSPETMNGGRNSARGSSYRTRCFRHCRGKAERPFRLRQALRYNRRTGVARGGQRGRECLESVCDGLSPKRKRYSTAKRPRWPKPHRDAISVTRAPFCALSNSWRTL